MPIWVWSASQAEAQAQVWQIGSHTRLLAIPAASEPMLGPILGTADCRTLLVYDHVSTKLGAQLRAQGSCYADAMGNAWLSHPSLFVNGQDKEPANPAELHVSSPVWHVQLLRLLFQLVLTPALAAYSIPRLAAHTQLPVGVVQQVVRTLAKQALWDYEAPLGVSPLRLPAPARHWLAHYASTLRRRLNAQHYRPRRPTPLAEWWQRTLPAASLWSGEAAAHLLLGRPEPPTSLTLYSHQPRPQLVQHLDLVPAAKGPIELLNAFAPATCFASTDPRCVPPLLVYADLLTSPQPANELLTQELHARYLAYLLAE